MLASAEVDNVSARWLTTTALQIPNIKLKAVSASGEAKDLGELEMNAFEGSVDGRLKALSEAQASLQKDIQLKPRHCQNSLLFSVN